MDAHGTLHAVAPDGTRKWKVAGAGNKGLAVGADGTVYVSSEVTVRAFGPDGAAVWTFVQSPPAFIMLGLAIGPDGNLFGVASEGIGVFSLTPAGALRWAVPEPYLRPIANYGEIAFGRSGGRSYLVFRANGHMRSLSLDGQPIFTVPGYGQPVTSPLDGSIHTGDRAYGADGSLLWSFGLSTSAPPDVGPDGTHYFAFLASELHALDGTGRSRWKVGSTDWLGRPSVDPAGTRLLLDALDSAADRGVLQARACADGALLWRLPLPAGQTIDTPPAFSGDGSTAYLMSSRGALPQQGWLTAVWVR